MLRKTIISCAAILLLSVSLPASETVKNANNWQIQFDRKEMARTDQVIQDLTHAINLWHDANLKGNNKQIAGFREQIKRIVTADIEATFNAVARYEREAGQSGKRLVARHDKRAERAENRRALRDDVRDLQHIRSLAKAKKLIWKSARISNAFSNQYRLLGDYLDILKKERRLNRIELAEDIAEH